jgi:hypothetical protein
VDRVEAENDEKGDLRGEELPTEEALVVGGALELRFGEPVAGVELGDAEVPGDLGLPEEVRGRGPPPGRGEPEQRKGDAPSYTGTTSGSASGSTCSAGPLNG